MKQEERFYFSSKKLLLMGAGLMLLLVFLIPALSWFEDSLAHSTPLAEQAPLQSPRSQVEFESGELVQGLHKEQDKELNSYGWVDSRHHYVRVPIERAMEILLNSDSLEPSDVFSEKQEGDL